MRVLRRLFDPETMRDLLVILGIVLAAYGLGALSVLYSMDAFRAGVVG